MLILSHKEGLRKIKLIQGRDSNMDDQNVDFGEALFDEDLKLK